MIVYLHGSPNKEMVEQNWILACPAGDKPNEYTDGEWWMDRACTVPKNFPVYFHYGEAEVPDPLGNYLISIGCVHKTRSATRGFWNRLTG